MRERAQIIHVFTLYDTVKSMNGGIECLELCRQRQIKIHILCRMKLYNMKKRN